MIDFITESELMCFVSHGLQVYTLLFRFLYKEKIIGFLKEKYVFSKNICKQYLKVYDVL